jgi:hypothetical protein
VAMTGQKFKAHKIAERVRQRQDFCRQSTSGFSDRLIFGPPFALRDSHMSCHGPALLDGAEGM